MGKISISLAADKRPDAISNVSESRGKSKKGGKRSPRQLFFSELMKRLAGDSGNNVANAYMSDRKKFKGMMMSIVSDMAKVDGGEE